MKTANRSIWPRLSKGAAGLLTILSIALNASGQQGVKPHLMINKEFSDAELVKKLPGFTNHYEEVNGVQIHYVEGGRGKPLFLLPGWPETWYAYHLIAPELAKNHQVFIVDIRGMGSSGKPQGGYDKKTMAADLYALMQKLHIAKANICGHDIGAMVAYSFAMNYPAATEKLILMDGMHPGDYLIKMPMLPANGNFGKKMDGKSPYAWWFSFNQVKGLPEQLLAGRSRYLIDWLIDYVSENPNAITGFDRSVYAANYDLPDNIRGGNGWYQSMEKDIEDAKAYGKFSMPVLGIGCYIGYGPLKMSLPHLASDFKVALIENSGHYIMEEQPKAVLDAISQFLE